MSINRGINRLSWLAAVVVPIVIFFWAASTESIVWSRFGIFLLVVAAASWGLVRLVGWVVAGFQKEEKSEAEKKLESMDVSGRYQ